LFKKAGTICAECAYGVLLALSFPPMPFNLLAFVALVPFYCSASATKAYFFAYIPCLFHLCCNKQLVEAAGKKIQIFLVCVRATDCAGASFFFFVPVAAYKYIKRKYNLGIALSRFLSSGQPSNGCTQ
jgi:hypothetical protein